MVVFHHPYTPQLTPMLQTILLQLGFVFVPSKLQTAVTFDRNVRFRLIICQNTRNRRRNPWANPKGDLVNSFFQKTPLSSSKIGFKIQPPIFPKVSSFNLFSLLWLLVASLWQIQLQGIGNTSSSTLVVCFLLGYPFINYTLQV